jgi:tripartite-type tricarboxylate transporter receptor subunit TctC
MLMRLALGVSLLFGASLAASAASAQQNGWPSKPIHFIVPLPAGSAADVVARLIGKGLTEKLGQTVIVDDRDGASGMLGTAQIAQATPDGYTLGIATTTTLVTVPIMNHGTRYDAQKDFSPISMIGYSPYVLVTNPSVPAKTVSEFIALAKAKPGQLTYSSVGDASLATLAVDLFSNIAGVQLNQIPYKSSTQAVLDLLAGRIDSQFGILTTSHQFIREGKLNALGVTTLKRIPEYPDIPTIAESGLPGYEASLWFAVIAPANLPPEISGKLNQAIGAILDDAGNRDLLFNQAIVVDLSSPSELKARIGADFTKWEELAAKAGL